MNPETRLSDADRDRAAAELVEHYAEGRLDAEEHAERLDAIWTARVAADLEPIFADLPRHGAGAAVPWPPVSGVAAGALRAGRRTADRAQHRHPPAVLDPDLLHRLRAVLTSDARLALERRH